MVENYKIPLTSKHIMYIMGSNNRNIGGLNMKATGIVRKLDELGRVVLPIELRRQLGMDIRDVLEISVNGDSIILTKYVPKCLFCKSEDEVIERLGRHICRKCIDDI